MLRESALHLKGVAMPRKRPDHVRGSFYHFYNRGAHRLPVFREPDNFLFALRKVKLYCRMLYLSPIAYCLMPNHYHLLIRQDGEEPARLLPQRVFNSYSKAYNKRYEHSGTLFEGSYWVVSVESEAHLLHLCRYIHANPVTHGLVDDVADWPYSNYLEWIGGRTGTLVDRDFVQAHFPSPHSYGQFVADNVATRQFPEALEYLKAW
jgi:REP element-mobilizing transposase RayT